MHRHIYNVAKTKGRLWEAVGVGEGERIRENLTPVNQPLFGLLNMKQM